MHILVKHGSITMFNKTINICNKKVKPTMVKANMGLYGIPEQCPIDASFIHCYKGEILMKLPEAQLRLLLIITKGGTGSIMMNITHDTGFSCFESQNKILAV